MKNLKDLAEGNNTMNLRTQEMNKLLKSWSKEPVLTREEITQCKLVSEVAKAYDYFSEDELEYFVNQERQNKSESK